MNRLSRTPEALKNLLDQKTGQYNSTSFIACDPISIPHQFSKKEDIEISGFLAAVISWGNRKSILASAQRMIRMMDRDPHRFLLNANPSDLKPLRKFVHRTFNGDDCIVFMNALKQTYVQYKSLEDLFLQSTSDDMASRISSFRDSFFRMSGNPGHALKHLPDPVNGSAAKRINMYLRWMVRKDQAGVDFGIWERIRPGELICPLDVHSGRIARQLGLLQRRTNDWKAAMELTGQLRLLDPEDPVKYDFALFGMGAIPMDGS